MGEHFTGIITIGAGIIIIVIIVLVGQATVLDNATREMIQSELTEWGNTVVKNKEITMADVNKLKETISATGVVCDLNMVLVVNDTNLGRKVSQTQKDRAGENAQYEIHYSEIMKEIEENGSYPIPSGATFSASEEMVTDSMLQTIINSFFMSNGSNSGSTVAEYTVLVP